jgi:hypothetical protein
MGEGTSEKKDLHRVRNQNLFFSISRSTFKHCGFLWGAD